MAKKHHDRPVPGTPNSTRICHQDQSLADGSNQELGFDFDQLNLIRSSVDSGLGMTGTISENYPYRLLLVESEQVRASQPRQPSSAPVQECRYSVLLHPAGARSPDLGLGPALSPSPASSSSGFLHFGWLMPSHPLRADTLFPKHDMRVASHPTLALEAAQSVETPPSRGPVPSGRRLDRLQLPLTRNRPLAAVAFAPASSFAKMDGRFARKSGLRYTFQRK
ncbi:hypothetical protein QBC39DRAFT_432180 [Podospora conica]|nr:hypothetical protein QBC39DRAFT_432180 [Schizothecium conicum]